MGEVKYFQGGHGNQFSGGNAQGGGGEGMEARVAKLESDVGHIQRDVTEIKQDIREMRKDAREDFRILFASLIVVAVGLAGIMAKVFGWF